MMELNTKTSQILLNQIEIFMLFVVFNFLFGLLTLNLFGKQKWIYITAFENF